MILMLTEPASWLDGGWYLGGGAADFRCWPGEGIGIGWELREPASLDKRELDMCVVQHVTGISTQRT